MTLKKDTGQAWDQGVWKVKRADLYPLPMHIHVVIEMGPPFVKEYQRCSWGVSDVENPRFDWSGCEWQEGAKELYEEILKYRTGEETSC